MMTSQDWLLAALRLVCEGRGGVRRFTRSWLLLSIALPLPGWAYSSYDLGNLACSTYLERRAEDQHNGVMQNTAFIHAYLSGYVTAGNMMHGLVGDDAKDIAINIHVVVQWLDAWCLEHPDVLVAVALESFWVEAVAAKEIAARKKAAGGGSR